MDFSVFFLHVWFFGGFFISFYNLRLSCHKGIYCFLSQFFWYNWANLFWHEKHCSVIGKKDIHKYSGAKKVQDVRHICLYSIGNITSARRLQHHLSNSQNICYQSSYFAPGISKASTGTQSIGIHDVYLFTTKLAMHYRSDVAFFSFFWEWRKAYCTLRNGTLRNETKSVLCEIKSVLCEMEIWPGLFKRWIALSAG